jgi:hypothetical protein
MALNRDFFQTGWVVADIWAAMKEWVGATGGGPFYIRESVKPDGLMYRGEPAALEMSVAIAMIGGMQVELIQQLNDGPSAFREVFPGETGGLHHIGGFSDDIDRDIKQYRDSGIEIATQGNAGGMRFVYFDTRASIGCMTELLDRRHAGPLERRMRMATAVAESWDGTKPFRTTPSEDELIAAERGEF